MQDRQGYDKFFSGNLLYGDDFSDEQLLSWFKEEDNAFYEMHYSPTYTYPFFALDKKVLRKALLNIKNNATILGIGSGDGQELKSFIEKIGTAYIIENGNYSLIDELKDRTVLMKANYKGVLPFEDNKFDFIVCFSSLHHIANISFVMAELFRVLKPSGYLFIREPIVSMGDWRVKRPGLTKNERGIPIKVFREIIHKTGFRIEKEAIWNFRPLSKLVNVFYKKSIFNNTLLSHLDLFFSKIFLFNYRYHSKSWWHKMMPSSVFYILSKK